MKNVINRILKIISTAIFIVLVLIIAVIILYIVRVNFFASNDKLGDIRINIFTILTQSMYPTIKAGDVVVTYKNIDNKYDTGDVITFISENNGGINITHRIKEVYSLNNSFSYKTKGDNNNTSDSEIISGSNVLGKVILKVPKAGYIQQFLVSKTGWIVAVILPAMGIIIYDILKLIKVVVRKVGISVKDDERSIEARKRLKEVIEDETEKK